MTWHLDAFLDRCEGAAKVVGGAWKIARRERGLGQNALPAKSVSVFC
jgi:hypothetical protein